MFLTETIKYNNSDMNLKIALGSGQRMFGSQQEIDNLTVLTENELINPVNDTEVRRFKNIETTTPVNLSFYFYVANYTNTFGESGAGFTSEEINSRSLKLLNSFFIIELYDSYDPYTQSKILTTYMTKILDGDSDDSGYSIQIPKYKIYSTAINQFYYLHIPQSFIDAQTGSTVYVYASYMFYNAKGGGVCLFYNKDINDNIVKRETLELMYFKIELNLETNTWKFINTSYPNVLAYQVVSTSDYVSKINDTVNGTENKRQNYPTGSTFNSTTGSYEVI